MSRLAVAIEAGARKVFASALDWPGWSRSARTEAEAVEVLLAYAPRYAIVAGGIKSRAPDPGDRAAVQAIRDAVLDILRRPSDGSPIAGRKWTARYAARRIAWHALDHAWEMQDRSD